VEYTRRPTSCCDVEPSHLSVVSLIFSTNTGDGERLVTKPGQDGAGASGDLTSFHVLRAEQGDVASLEWVVRRFSPLLLAQAEFRLGPRLRRLWEPEDLVGEVWAITLPRLGGLARREGRKTPVLLRFLTTTLLNRIIGLVKKEVTGPRGRQVLDGKAEAEDILAGLPSDSSGVVTSAVRRERDGTVTTVLAGLEPEDREIIVLRGIEQNPGATVAVLLGISEAAVSMRYHRALERLRKRLPSSVFEELSAD
jgi:RNA polymerase sigma factor (sigma-70 family)